MKNYKITKSLLLMFFPFLLFSVVIASAVHMISLQNILKSEAHQANVQLLRHIDNNLELLFTTIQRGGDHLYDDEAFLDILNRDNLYDYRIYQEFDNQALGIKLNFDLIHSVAMIFPEMDMVYDTLYGFQSLSTYKQNDRLLDLTDIQLTSRIIKRNIFSSSFVSKTDQPVITLIKPLPSVPLRLKAKGNMIVNMGMEALYQNLIGSINENHKREMIIFNNELTPILYSEKSLIYHNLPLITDILISEEETNFQLEEQRYQLTRTVSSWNGWLIVLASDVSDLQTSQQTLMIIVLSSGILLILFLSFFAYLVIRRTTRPLEDILDKITKTDSNWNIFPTLGNSFENIIHDNSLLKDKISLLEPIYKRHFLSQLILNESKDEGKIYRWLEEFNVQFTGELYGIAVVKPNNFYEMVRNHIEMTVALLAIEETFEDSIQSAPFDGLVLGKVGEQVVLLFNFTVDQISRYKFEMTQILDNSKIKIKDSLGIELMVTVSRITGNLTDLSGCFHEASDLMKQRLGIAEETVIYTDEYHENRGKEGYLDLDIEDKLIGLIISSDHEAAIIIVKNVFNMYRLQGRDDHIGFQLLMFRLVNIFYSLTVKLDIDLSDDSTLPNLLSLTGSIRTIKGAEQLFSDLLIELCARTKSSRNTRENFHAKKILDFINDHFEEDISMEMLAEEVGLSPSYIHRIIREQSGKTFLDMVVTKKMEQACILLNQNMTVQDVASAVGYSSSRYFIKVFKERYSLTPNEYKKQFLN